MSETVFTAPELAKRWRCKPEIVRALLDAGKLRGFNVASPTARRPRWRISLSAVIDYEEGAPPLPPAPKGERRRRKALAVPEGPF